MFQSRSFIDEIYQIFKECANAFFKNRFYKISMLQLNLFAKTDLVIIVKFVGNIFDAQFKSCKKILRFCR